MLITIIAAMAENGVIGREGRLPWHIPADLARFRDLTMGHPVIMGRRTYEGIGRPLPGRSIIVLTRSSSYRASGCLVAHSVDEALTAAEGATEVFVAGGADIYRQFLPLAHRIHLTLVHDTLPGDVEFPPIPAAMKEIWRQDMPGTPPITFISYNRNNS
jgi:dihydrofolate reductase